MAGQDVGNTDKDLFQPLLYEGVGLNPPAINNDYRSDHRYFTWPDCYLHFPCIEDNLIQITKEQVKNWSACTDGYRWFLEKFPQGGAYADVHGSLVADKRFDDARWLVDKMYSTFLDNPEFIKTETAATDKMVVELTSMEFSGDQVDGENNSGDYAQIGSSGDSARIGSSGDYAQIGSSGDYAQITASGKRSVVACAGSVKRIVLGEGGCAAVPWHDGERTRFAVAYVGENGIEANVPYCLNDEGKFVKIEE